MQSAHSGTWGRASLLLFVGVPFVVVQCTFLCYNSVTAFLWRMLVLVIRHGTEKSVTSHLIPSSAHVRGIMVDVVVHA